MNLFGLVSSSPACTALIGSDPVRFFEFGTAPQLEALPYVTHQHITGTPYNRLSGPAEADHVSTQIDVWATSTTECKAIAEAVRSALENDCYVTSWLGTSKEGEAFRTTFTVQHIELR